MIDYEQLYWKLPVWAQHVAVTAEGWNINRRRFGPKFTAALDSRSRYLGMSPPQVRDLQTQRVRTMLLAGTKTPFWRKRFAEYEVNPAGVNPFLELSKLPLLSKTEVQEHRDALVNDEFKKTSLRQAHTSGTTGSGLVFWETDEADASRWATWWRYRHQHGINPTDWCGYFGGRSVVSPNQSKPPWWRINFAGRQILFSGYHLSETTAVDYLKELNECQPPWLHGYPSLLALLAAYKQELDFTLSYKVKIVTIGAETLLQSQRAVIEAAFQAPVVQHYGLSEGVANISECVDGKLHVDEDYAFVEFVPFGTGSNDKQIVGTNLTNVAFPLFRYATGDVAHLCDEPCNCGNPGRVVESVDGRKEDYIVLSDGSMVGRLDHIFKDIVEVREAQFFQDKPGIIELRIVKGVLFTEQSERRVLAETRKRLGNRANVSIRYCERIERSATGKLRFVVSEMRRASIGNKFVSTAQ